MAVVKGKAGYKKIRNIWRNVWSVKNDMIPIKRTSVEETVIPRHNSDATFMHMKDDHMRNAQLKPGYNIQIGVDSEYIVGVGVFSDRNDTNTLIPFVKQMEKTLGRKYEKITADAGYENEENYLWLEKRDGSRISSR